MKINIFDFDGTITMDAWPNNLIKKMGCDLNDIKKYIKENKGTLVEKFFGYFNKFMTDNNVKLSKDELFELEQTVKYNPGIQDFLKGLKTKNYIVSGGFLELLQNIEIAKYFDGIYGTTAEFDVDGFLVAAKEIMTDDKKVSAIKDILKKNGRKEDDCRDVTFIGDGLSDVPAMRFVKSNGGRSIFVHQPFADEELYKKLNAEDAIDFRCVADYRDESELVKIISGGNK